MRLINGTCALTVLIVTGVTVSVPSYAAGPRIGPSDQTMVDALAGSEIPSPQLGEIRGGSLSFPSLLSEITSRAASLSGRAVSSSSSSVFRFFNFFNGNSGAGNAGSASNGP